MLPPTKLRPVSVSFRLYPTLPLNGLTIFLILAFCALSPRVVFCRLNQLSARWRIPPKIDLYLSGGPKSIVSCIVRCTDSISRLPKEALYLTYECVVLGRDSGKSQIGFYGNRVGELGSMFVFINS